MDPDFDALFARAHIRPRDRSFPRIRLRHWGGAVLMLAVVWACYVIGEAAHDAVTVKVWGQP